MFSLIFWQFCTRFTSEMIFQLNNKQVSLGAITDAYADVYLHVEEKKGLHSFVKANKVILAYHSPYFHRIFQSRENIQAVDLAFVGIDAAVVQDVVTMLYGISIQISEKKMNYFTRFLKLLEIEFEINDGSESVPKSKNLKRINTIENEEFVNEGHENESEFLSDENYVPRSKYSLPTTSQNQMPTSTLTTAAPITQTSTTPVVPSSSFHSSMPFKEATLASSAVVGTKTSTMPETSSSKPIPKVTSPTMTTMNVAPESARPTTIETSLDVIPPRYTTKRGEPAFSDNWTETSQSDLEERLRDMNFKIGKSPEGHHADYICSLCGKVVRAISRAEAHYKEKHLNSDKEIEIIRKAMEYREEAIDSIKELRSQINAGCSKLLAVNQLR